MHTATPWRWLRRTSAAGPRGGGDRGPSPCAADLEERLDGDRDDGGGGGGGGSRSDPEEDEPGARRSGRVIFRRAAAVPACCTPLMSYDSCSSAGDARDVFHTPSSSPTSALPCGAGVGGAGARYGFSPSSQFRWPAAAAPLLQGPPATAASAAAGPPLQPPGRPSVDRPPPPPHPPPAAAPPLPPNQQAAFLFFSGARPPPRRERTTSAASASSVATATTSPPPTPLPPTAHRFATALDERTPLLHNRSSLGAIDPYYYGAAAESGPRRPLAASASAAAAAVFRGEPAAPDRPGDSRPEPPAGAPDVEDVDYLPEGLSKETESWLAYWMDSMVRRFIILGAMPTLIVLGWCAMPFPLAGNEPSMPPKTNFWFFLAYYYGFFNAVSILLITFFFRLYSLDWYPKSVGGVLSVIGVWLVSEAIGGCMIFFLEPWVARHVMTWVCLLLVTMLFPLIAAWLKIRRHERHRVRRSLTVAQKLFSAPDSNRAWIRPSLIAPATTAAPNPPPEDPPATGGADDSIVGSGFEAEPPPLPPPPHSAGSVRSLGSDSARSISTSSASSSSSASTLSPTFSRANPLASQQALDPYSLSLTLSDNSRQPSNSYVPTSYTRFLWFLTAITIALASVLLSQLYAHIFLSTLPHSAPANLVYIYSLTLTSTLMSTLCGAVTRDKIRSPPLELTFRFYFYTTYFVFYRTLFARLRSVDQFAYVQFASSLGVVVMYPAMMSRRCWALFGYFGCAGGAGGGYKRYKRDIGRGFWLRNVAENATMMIFLSIATLLHFSPERNLRFYPYFQFNDPGDPYNYPMTLYCTLVIWASELLSSYAARLVFKRAFGLSITRQASREVKAFPETAVVLGLVTVFVCMGMVLAFCRVDFG